MNGLLWTSLFWVLYQCLRSWSNMNWFAIQNFLRFSEVNKELSRSSARSVARIACFLFVFAIWRVLSRARDHLRYKTLLEKLIYYMDTYKIPKDIQECVLQCYAQAWSMNKIKFPVPNYSMDKILPVQLLSVVKHHIKMTVSTKAKLNNECLRFFAAINPKSTTLYYSSGDLVCRKGTWADKLYVVVYGLLEVTSDSGQHLETMSRGDVFGEIGVLRIDGNYMRTVNVRSMHNSQVIVLKEKDVNEIIKYFPEAKRALEALGRRRLLRTMLMSLANDDE